MQTALNVSKTQQLKENGSAQAKKEAVVAKTMGELSKRFELIDYICEQLIYDQIVLKQIQSQLQQLKSSLLQSN